MTREEREETISTLEYIKEYCHYEYEKETIDKAIKVLEQEPKTGHWVDTGSGQKCSECGEIQYGYDNFRHFCANCGAKMDKED